MASERVRRAAALCALAAAVLIAAPAAAQQVSIDLGGEGSLTLRAVQLFGLVTLLSLAPAIAVMATCFPFIVTVLSILRQAIGVQQAPPSMMIVSLALFLTYFVMEPVFVDAWTQGLEPLFAQQIDAQTAFERTLAPFRVFMEARVDPQTLAEMAAVAPGREAAPPADPAPLSILAPAFLLSEMQRAFEIGFLVFLPFLLIDLAVASILMAMGMMMVPPAVVSLPFKLAFFVVADGWSLLAGALVRGYGQ
ncbi:flagellar type III secretion system pore protein FliP [Oceanicella actignis]|uniref:Flagellar biosynthetic protein FliP n=1 Tax=Oceanicella actignis TaxID=1189325 RepID=A0A1M7T8W6_9RHOB|nr:flagellar type III secretion system pore protein FliP [Oceanicella actignis]SET50067.1 flagellar biosynthetic protein FliP [Oceanicella actignis]SHN67175.1 flagellar biosynthetic protein FliP [Oceanicella actignis]